MFRRVLCVVALASAGFVWSTAAWCDPPEGPSAKMVTKNIRHEQRVYVASLFNSMMSREFWRRSERGRASTTSIRGQLSDGVQVASSKEGLADVGNLLLADAENSSIGGLSDSLLDGRLGLSVSPSHSWLDSSLNAPTSNSHYEMESNSLSLSADYAFTDKISGGISVPFSGSDIKQPSGSRTDVNGGTFMPYLAYSFGNGTSIDVSMGYGRSETSSSRPGNGGDVTSNYNSNTYMVGGGIGHSVFLDQLMLSGRVGYSFSRTRDESYKEQNKAKAFIVDSFSSKEFNNGSVQIGGRVGYYFEQVAPYVSLDYSYANIINKPSETIERDDLTAGIGASLPFSKSFQGSIDYRKVFLRTKTKNETAMASLRFAF